MSTLADRLRLALERMPQKPTQAELARACGVKPPSVNEWFSGSTKALKADSYRLAAKFLGVRREWLETGVGDPGWTTPPQTEGVSVHPVAQEMSHPQFIVAPTLSWEQLMSQPEELPPEFHLVLRDDAMAPRAGAGVKIKLRSGSTAHPGDAVLVRSVDGQLYFREYRALLGQAWEAHATNPAYPSLRSDAHHLQVLAVFIGIDTPWAALSR